MRNLTLATIVLFALVGCTPQKRLNRLLNKHPYLAETKDSTIYDTTRVITKDVKVDTVTSLEGIRRDTMIINRQNLWIKTIVHKDSIYVFGNCESDTIETIKEIKVPVQMFTYKKTKWYENLGKRVWWLIILFGLGFLAYMIIKLFRG